jgi:hypothetical protein
MICRRGGYAEGQRLAFRETDRGADTRAVLAELVRDAVAALPIAKRMRWGASAALEFARPVHWVVLLFGEEDGFGESSASTAVATPRAPLPRAGCAGHRVTTALRGTARRGAGHRRLRGAPRPDT